MKRTSYPPDRANGDRRLLWFGILSLDEKRDCIRKLADAGRGDETIASLTALSVDDVRRILSVSA
jgi:hypothetical protein